LIAYLNRSDDYYFVLEDRCTNQPEGTIAIYDVLDCECAELGRWVLAQGSAGAYASLFLAWGVTFEQLGLQWFYTRTVEENLRVRKILEFTGLVRIEGFDKEVLLADGKHKLGEYRMDRRQWLLSKDRLASRVLGLTELLRSRLRK
jgi:RimJ/RimL family protein N-acetyltransferase